jgi:tRNA pseudouridine65 synthase
VLDILFRDEHLVAIHKPSGLLVHRSNLDRHETRFAVQLLRDQIGRHVFPAHRLDKGTSGVLLFALDAATASTLGRQFESGAVAKDYLAVVRGWPPADGWIDHPLSRQFDDYGRSMTDAQMPALPALTGFRRLATVELDAAVDRYPTARYALMALQPQTGRPHQLRRHLKHIAHPIIGDATHGKGRHNRYFQERFGSHRLLLACTALRLAHPASGKPMVFSAAPAADFSNVLAALGWDDRIQAMLESNTTTRLRPSCLAR